MQIILNGEKYNIQNQDCTVEELVIELSKKWNIDLAGAVVLVDEDIIKKDVWKEKKIYEGANLEVLSFVSGG